MNESTQKRRISYIDMGKGICILLVILGHQVDRGSDLRFTIYSFHMALFFILSGMVDYLSSSYKKPRFEFYCKKAKGLLVPYVVWSVIFIVVDFIRILFKQKPLNLLVIDLIKMFSGYGINVLWFLITLFICQIIIYEIKQKNEGIKIFAIVFFLAFIANCTYFVIYSHFFVGQTTIVYNIIRWCITSLFRPFIVLPFLIIGEIVLKCINKVSVLRIALFTAVFVLINIIVATKLEMLVDIVSLEYKSFIYLYLAGMTGTIYIISICKWIEEQSYIMLVKVLTYFGTHSLLIMVLHEHIPLRNISSYIVSMITSGEFSKSLEYIFWMIITIIIMICIEKPYNELLKQITSKCISNYQIRR